MSVSNIPQGGASRGPAAAPSGAPGDRAPNPAAAAPSESKLLTDYVKQLEERLAKQDKTIDELTGAVLNSARPATPPKDPNAPPYTNEQLLALEAEDKGAFVAAVQENARHYARLEAHGTLKSERQRESMDRLGTFLKDLVGVGQGDVEWDARVAQERQKVKGMYPFIDDDTATIVATMQLRNPRQTDDSADRLKRSLPRSSEAPALTDEELQSASGGFTEEEIRVIKALGLENRLLVRQSDPQLESKRLQRIRDLRKKQSRNLIMIGDEEQS